MTSERPPPPTHYLGYPPGEVPGLGETNVDTLLRKFNQKPQPLRDTTRNPTPIITPIIPTHSTLGAPIPYGGGPLDSQDIKDTRVKKSYDPHTIVWSMGVVAFLVISVP